VAETMKELLKGKDLESQVAHCYGVLMSLYERDFITDAERAKKLGFGQS
jgi:hypothetical protein